MPKNGDDGPGPSSELEVVPGEWTANPPPQAGPPGNDAVSERQVLAAHPDEKQFVASSSPLADASLKETPAFLPESTPRHNRRHKWILWVLLLAVIVVGAVLGGILGTTLHHPKSQPSGEPLAVNGPSTVSSTFSSMVGSTVNSTATPVATTQGLTMSGTATIASIYSYPTAISWGSPHLEVFALDSADVISWKWKNSSTPSWNPQNNTLESLYGVAAPFQQGVAAVTRGLASVDIFVTGTDFALYHKYHRPDFVWGPSLADWDDRGGVLSSAPTAISWSQDRLDVFVLGEAPSNELLQTYWLLETGWSEWIGLGGSWELFTPAAVMWGPDRIDVFVVDSNTKSLHHTYWDGTLWQPKASFEDLGGYCTSRPVAVSRGSGVIDIFVRGGDAGLWHLSYSNGWSRWVSIDPKTTIQAEPEAVSWNSSNIELFAWGTDATLLHKSLSVTDGDEAWTPSSGFDVLGERLTGPPKAVCDGAGSVHVFAYLQGGQVGHRAFNQTLETWYPSSGFELLGNS